ncbi:MAG: hypothetical protein IK144_11920 [Bacteroidaceae bacterium]|nr:hypothetical protein [Bacteroidaceae bacterium]
MKKNSLITIIQKSCLTGQAVWIYRGPSERSARLAYWRACKRELERVRQWGETLAKRRSNIQRLLSCDSSSSSVLDAGLTAEQIEAAKQLLAIGKRETDGKTEFYNHIIEERRRRSIDREIRRKMRERGSYR